MQGPIGMAEVKRAERYRKTPEYKRKLREEIANSPQAALKGLGIFADAVSLLLPATGALRVIRGLSQVRRGRLAWGASGRAFTRGTQHKARALVQNEARKAGVPIANSQIGASVDAANRNFRVAKRLRSKARVLQHKGKRLQKQGYNRMRPATAIDRDPEPQPLVDKEGRLIHAGYVPMMQRVAQQSY